VSLRITFPRINQTGCLDETSAILLPIGLLVYPNVCKNQKRAHFNVSIFRQKIWRKTLAKFFLNIKLAFFPGNEDFLIFL
jgi:hypothetical protein